MGMKGRFNLKKTAESLRFRKGKIQGMKKVYSSENARTKKMFPVDFLLLGIQVLLGCVLFGLILAGCSKDNDAVGQKIRDMEFTVVAEAEEPEELAKIIVEKKTSPFKLTYSNDQALYIAVGYGEQSTGGYSIQVKELYLGDNSIYIDTELIGPSKEESSGADVSYPYIVVKTEFVDKPVVFQ